MKTTRRIFGLMAAVGTIAAFGGALALSSGLAYAPAAAGPLPPEGQGALELHAGDPAIQDIHPNSIKTALSLGSQPCRPIT